MIADHETLVTQSFEDTMDHFRYGFESYECESEPDLGEEYEEFDVEAARADAIYEFNQGFRSYDAEYRA